MKLYLLACLLISSHQDHTTGAPQDAPSGVDIFNKMLTKYHEAESVKGTIQFNQSAEGSGASGTSTILTNVQAKKPNLVYIEQAKLTGEPRSYRAVCDGKQIAYNAPRNWQIQDPAKRMIYEPAPDSVSKALDMFAPLLLDRQLPVALALYNAYEVSLLTKAIKDVRLDTTATVGGREAYRLVASFAFSRYGPAQPDKGVVDAWIPIWIYVSKDYDLLGMVYEEMMQVERITIKITNQWVVNLTVNQPVDDGLFKLP